MSEGKGSGFKEADIATASLPDTSGTIDKPGSIPPPPPGAVVHGDGIKDGDLVEEGRSVSTFTKTALLFAFVAGAGAGVGGTVLYQHLAGRKAAPKTAVVSNDAGLSESMSDAGTKLALAEQPDLTGDTKPKPLARSGADNSRIRIVGTGELMLRPGDTYDFSEVSDLIKPADLALASIHYAPVESGAAERVNKRRSKPLLYTTSDSLDLLVKAGFDDIAVGDHIANFGDPSVVSAVKRLEGVGMNLLGARAQEKDFFFKEHTVKGVKVCTLAYVFGLQAGLGNPELVNTLNLNDPEIKIEESLEPDVKEMDEAKCGLKVLYAHWGVVNQQTTPDVMKKNAKTIANAGFDLILGAHPHVLQNYELVVAADGRKVPVFYSLGNFATHQRGMKYRASAVVGVTYKIENGKPVLDVVEYTPTFAKQEKSGDGLKVSIVNLVADSQPDKRDAALCYTRKAFSALEHPVAVDCSK